MLYKSLMSLFLHCTSREMFDVIDARSLFMGLVKRLEKEKIIMRNLDWFERWMSIFENAGKVSTLIKELTGAAVDFSDFECDVLEFAGVADRQAAASVMSNMMQAMNSLIHPHEWKLDKSKGKDLKPDDEAMKESFHTKEPWNESNRFSGAAKRMYSLFSVGDNPFK